MKKQVVFMVVGDAGAAEALAPVIPLVAEHADVMVFADPKGAGTKTLTKLNIAHEVVESIDATRANLVVCGTNGKAQQLQRQATLAAKEKNKPSIWVGDFYLSGCEKGVRDIEPRKLTVLDESAARLIEDARPGDFNQGSDLVVTGNPAFDELAGLKARRYEILAEVQNQFGIRHDEKLIVFGGSASNQFDALEMKRTVQSIMHRHALIGAQDATPKKDRLLFSFHPADPQREELEALVRHFGHQTFKDDIRVYLAADAVVAQYSTIGVKSALLGVPTLFALLPSMRAYQHTRGNAWPFFPQIAVGAAEAAWSLDEIRPALARMLSTDEPDYHAARFEAVRRNFSSLIDGKAAQRVAKLIANHLFAGTDELLDVLVSIEKR